MYDEVAGLRDWHCPMCGFDHDPGLYRCEGCDECHLCCDCPEGLWQEEEGGGDPPPEGD